MLYSVDSNFNGPIIANLVYCQHGMFYCFNHIMTTALTFNPNGSKLNKTWLSIQAYSPHGCLSHQIMDLMPCPNFIMRRNMYLRTNKGVCNVQVNNMLLECYKHYGKTCMYDFLWNICWTSETKNQIYDVEQNGQRFWLTGLRKKGVSTFLYGKIGKHRQLDQ